MHFKKKLFSIAFSVAFFSTFDASAFFRTQATSDCHPCLKDTYFSTLLQTEPRGLCRICAIGGMTSDYLHWTRMKTAFSECVPSPIFGAISVVPTLIVPLDLGWALQKTSRMVIKGPPNPLVMALLRRWETEMTVLWTLARLARLQVRLQKTSRTADNRATALARLHAYSDYKDALSRFHSTLYLAPETSMASYYRATAQLSLGNTESMRGRIAHAQDFYRGAIEAYTGAIPRSHRTSQAYVLRSFAKFKLGTFASDAGHTAQARRLYQAAISDCNEAIALYQRNTAGLRDALGVYTELCDHDYPEALLFRERYAFAYHLRGLEKQALGEIADAVSDLQKAKLLELIPEYR